jgi:hypothetical protein
MPPRRHTWHWRRKAWLGAGRRLATRARGGAHWAPGLLCGAGSGLGSWARSRRGPHRAPARVGGAVRREEGGSALAVVADWAPRHAYGACSLLECWAPRRVCWVALVALVAVEQAFGLVRLRSGTGPKRLEKGNPAESCVHAAALSDPRFATDASGAKLASGNSRPCSTSGNSRPYSTWAGPAIGVAPRCLGPVGQWRLG